MSHMSTFYKKVTDFQKKIIIFTKKHSNFDLNFILLSKNSEGVGLWKLVKRYKEISQLLLLAIAIAILAIDCLLLAIVK